MTSSLKKSPSTKSWPHGGIVESRSGFRETPDAGGADRKFYPRLAAWRRHLEHLGLYGRPSPILSVLKTMQGQSVQAMAERFAKIGTIDMRIDYLRPGVGDHFIATGYVLRTGNKVAVTRMELHNNERQLIAVGTGAYVVA